MNPDDSKSNIGALGVGFFLIIAVVAIFFLKDKIFNKESASSEETALETPETKEQAISSKDLGQKKANENLKIIDIREQEFFEASHIIDSVNIPAEIFVAEAAQFKKNFEYVLVDEVGMTPRQKDAMELMKEAGFKKVSYLEEGFQGWKAQLNPTVSAGDPYSFTDQAKVTYLKSEELKEALAKESNLHLIDLRKESDFKAWHLPDAVNIELSQLESRRKEIPYGKKIILYDNDQLRTFQGAVRLYDMAVFNVYALLGDLKTLQEKEQGAENTPKNEVRTDQNIKP